MLFAIRKPRDKFIFVSKNQLNDPKIGCNEASNLEECIEREQFETKGERKDIENYE